MLIIIILGKVDNLNNFYISIRKINVIQDKNKIVYGSLLPVEIGMIP